MKYMYSISRSMCAFKVKYGNITKKTFQCESVNFFLPTIFSICFGCSKEPSH